MRQLFFLSLKGFQRYELVRPLRDSLCYARGESIANSLLIAVVSHSIGRVIKKSEPEKGSLFYVFSVPFLFGNTCHIGVNHNATAIFAHNDFFTQLDVHLFLRRNFVETTTASSSLYRNNS